MVRGDFAKEFYTVFQCKMKELLSGKFCNHTCSIIRELALTTSKDIAYGYSIDQRIAEEVAEYALIALSINGRSFIEIETESISKLKQNQY